MRLLQLVTRPQRRGAEVFAFTLAGELRRRGHAVTTIYLYPYDGPAALPLLEGDVVLPGNASPAARRLPGPDPRRLARLQRAIRRCEPQLVQVNGGPAVAYGALAARLTRRRPWALLYRNIGEPDRWLRGAFKRALFRRLVGPALDGVVGVSATTLAAVGRLYGEAIPRRQIVRAVDPAALRPARPAAEVRAALGVAAGAPVALYVGSLTGEKRVDRLMRLAHTLASELPGFSLWLLGDGPLRAALAAQGAALGLDGAVRFLGAREDVADFLAASDLLVLASDSEGMPGVVLEAGLLGRPVVATAVGGVAECVRDGDTGLLVTPGDEQALAGAVRSLLGDGERRRRMGARATAWVEERFTIGRVAGEYEAFYAELIERRQGGAAR
ncbi:MAG TPA: glycosyltransferase family 4 protein [Thermoanaerobaculia bacterium]|jgi:glycosyltransferase involved in cell wall biosynthesis|nr:glycosyltransferase family 4 protein [Thermoanaerobaculia bacterium]